MVERHSVIAIAGVGLSEDRYAEGRGSWQKKDQVLHHSPDQNVTFIAREDIDDSGFEECETRRNVVVEGLKDINELVGVRFQIGEAIFCGVKPADPCDRPSKLCGKEGFEEAFRGKGGVLAQILEGGMFRVGDELCVLAGL